MEFIMDISKMTIERFYNQTPDFGRYNGMDDITIKRYCIVQTIKHGSLL